MVICSHGESVKLCCCYLWCPAEGAAGLSWCLCDLNSLCLVAEWRACLFRRTILMWIRCYAIKYPSRLLPVWGETRVSPHISCKPCQSFLHVYCILICMDSAKGFIWCYQGYTEDFACFYSLYGQMSCSEYTQKWHLVCKNPTLRCIC